MAYQTDQQGRVILKAPLYPEDYTTFAGRTYHRQDDGTVHAAPDDVAELLRSGYSVPSADAEQPVNSAVPAPAEAGGDTAPDTTVYPTQMPLWPENAAMHADDPDSQQVLDVRDEEGNLKMIKNNVTGEIINDFSGADQPAPTAPPAPAPSTPAAPTGAPVEAPAEPTAAPTEPTTAPEAPAPANDPNAGTDGGTQTPLGQPVNPEAPTVDNGTPAEPLPGPTEGTENAPNSRTASPSNNAQRR